MQMVPSSWWRVTTAHLPRRRTPGWASSPSETASDLEWSSRVNQVQDEAWKTGRVPQRFPAVRLRNPAIHLDGSDDLGNVGSPGDGGRGGPES